jgi:hypothetical protein
MIEEFELIDALDATAGAGRPKWRGWNRKVHRALGPGLLESGYEACFCHEQRLGGLAFERQRPVGITYKAHLPDLFVGLPVPLRAAPFNSVESRH